MLISSMLPRSAHMPSLARSNKRQTSRWTNIAIEAGLSIEAARSNSGMILLFRASAHRAPLNDVTASSTATSVPWHNALTFLAGNIEAVNTMLA